MDPAFGLGIELLLRRTLVQLQFCEAAQDKGKHENNCQPRSDG